MRLSFYRVGRPSALALMLGAVTLSPSALAELNFDLGVTSEYLREGISATEGNVAVQTGLTWQHNSGFYLGGWASNLDRKDDHLKAEADLFVGYYWPLSKNVALDFAATRFNFIGDNDAWYQDYNELSASLLLHNRFAFNWRASNDYLGKDHSWQALSLSWVQPYDDFNFEFYVGNYHWLSKDINEGAAYSDDGKSHYWHFRLGVERTWNNWDYRLTFERAMLFKGFDAGSSFQFSLNRRFSLF